MERGLPMSQMTKRALEASLKELLRHKPLDKITVSDLTDHCGVNRMTFYYHFKDIYDLVEWCCEEDAARALAGQKTYDTWQQGFLQILPQPDIIEHFGNADAVPQLPERCLSRKAGIVRCCLYASSNMPLYSW